MNTNPEQPDNQAPTEVTSSTPEEHMTFGFESENRTIGPYRLQERIGEGGMGSVWKARQEQPVRRQVALKLIRPGLASPQVAARFRAERQALSMMDHPNIAKVLDVGEAPDGTPYFVMELVDGVSLTQYCNDCRLGIEARLQLFVDICDAIQHAHQKQIVHRDLKPSNILVTARDGKPLPKVIDFGLAKAIDQATRLTDESLLSKIGNVVGTLRYMAPEQAEAGAIDIDTRADIYSLGVILYELLTGSTPVEKASFGQQALLNALEKIRDQQPLRPSQRLESSDDASISSISDQRRINPARLKSILKGELDWIVMKALEKERDRRYETASQFAEDVENFLTGHAVTARPPSTTYRVRKFVRRYRAGVLTACLVFLTLVGGIIGTTMARNRAVKAEKLASDRALSESNAKETAQEALRKESVALANEKLQRKYAEAIAGFVRDDFLALTSIEGQQRFGETSEYELGKDTTLRELLDRAASKLESREDLDPYTLAELSWMIGVNYRGVGEFETAVKFLKRSYELYQETPEASELDIENAANSLGVAYLSAGLPHKAITIFEPLWEAKRLRLGEDHDDTLLVLHNLAAGYSATGNYKSALPLLELNFQLHTNRYGEECEETLDSMNNLAYAFGATGQQRKAYRLHEKTYQLRKRIHGARHLRTLSSAGSLSNASLVIGNTGKAVQLLEETLPVAREMLDEKQPELMSLENSFALALSADGQLEKAATILKIVLLHTSEKLGEEHPETLRAMNNLAAVYMDIDDVDSALPLFKKTFEIAKQRFGTNHPNTLVSMHNLARAYQSAGQLQKGIELLEVSLSLAVKKFGDKHRASIHGMESLAYMFSEAGRMDESRDMYRRALGIRREMFGVKHPETLGTTLDLAVAEIKLKEYESGVELLENLVAHTDQESITNRAKSWLRYAYARTGNKDQVKAMVAEDVADERELLGEDSIDFGLVLFEAGSDLLAVGAFDDAEAVVREYLEIRREKTPESWTTFYAMSMLGGALLGKAKVENGSNQSSEQKQLMDEAERLLIAGFNGIKQRFDSIAESVRKERVRQAIDWLIELSELRDQKDEVQKWRAEKVLLTEN